MIFPGLEPGSELGWATFGAPQPFPIGAQMFQFMVFNDPAWDYKTLNFDADWAKVVAIEKGDINVLQPNLDKFAARGGKLIQYHGWADQQIPSGSSTRFFTALASHAGGARQVRALLPDVHGAGDGPLRRRRRARRPSTC